ncbi:MAG: glycosyltransferase [Sporichthyaceae bacterium]
MSKRKVDVDERRERRMRIALLAPANNVHTHKWLDFYDRRGIDVYAISLESHRETGGFARPRVRTAYLPLRLGPVPVSVKAAYLATVPRLRRLLEQADPDLVHAHYVSSYGLLGALVNRHPYVVSVWGADVYDFPAGGPAQRKAVTFALRRADAICSTSQAMADETAKYTDAPIAITPFGVDPHQFAPAPRLPDGRVVFGIVKTMKAKYGIDVLLRAYRGFTDLVGPEAAARTDLVIVGGGPQLEEYQALAGELDLGERVRFTGAIAHAEVPAMINSFDVFVVPSVLDSESFGVAAVEAQACGVPVLVSAVGGLPEVIRDGATGFVVPPRDPEALAQRMRELHDDPALRGRLGAAGREHARAKYTWQENATRMLEVYSGLGLTSGR